MIIAGKEYETPRFSFSDMCALETWGLLVDSLSTRPLAFLSGFAALAVGGTLEDGQKAIDEHLSGGGTLDELIAELNKAVEESGFFKHAAAETKSD